MHMHAYVQEQAPSLSLKFLAGVMNWYVLLGLRSPELQLAWSPLFEL